MSVLPLFANAVCCYQFAGLQAVLFWGLQRPFVCFFLPSRSAGWQAGGFLKAVVFSHMETLQIFQICSILITFNFSLLKGSSGQSWLLIKNAVCKQAVLYTFRTAYRYTCRDEYLHVLLHEWTTWHLAWNWFPQTFLCIYEGAISAKSLEPNYWTAMTLK